MQRFYVASQSVWEEKLIIADMSIIHQFLKVLRVKPWDKVIIINWYDNFDYVHEVSEVNKRKIKLGFLSRLKKDSEINFNLNLYQALPNKLDKLEYIVQKATEVWFTKIVFFKADRSQKLNLSRSKIERLNKIIIEAVEQSGRNKIPVLKILDEIDLSNIKWENIYFHTKDDKSIDIKTLKIKNKKTVNLFVWPEGGWSDEELELFEKNVFFKIYLWSRILRSETVSSIVWFWVINN
jgi:16S rRNA (uracil1498-N3)-methyltransferase